MTRHLLIFCLLLTSATADDFQLTKNNYDKWKTFILPSEREVAYRKLNWHTSLPAAVSEARSKDKPILLWNYHGHPFGAGCHNGVITRNCFADEEVQRLSKDFVLVVENATRLDRESTYPGYGFFKKALPNNTDGYAQGIYVITPSGKVIGRDKWKSYGDVGVPELMRDSMNEWKMLSKEERTAPVKAGGGTKPETKLYPEDGLVLHFYTRDLVRDHSPESKDWNQDFVWFQKDEAKQFVPVPLKVGQKNDVPSFLIERFARFVLLDSVHGEPWQLGHGKEDIKVARLNSSITSIKNGIIKIELEGETRAETEGVWAVDHEEPSFKKRGYVTRLLGNAAYDTRKRRFVSFEMVGCGTCWGASFFRKNPNEKPIGCVMVLAGKGPFERIRPNKLNDYNWQQK